MSKQYPGGIISKTPVTPSGPYSTDSASGIWTLDQQAYWQKLGQWPTAGNFPIDPQFNYVTMLLHGDGTNGAQNNTFLDSSASPLTITRNGNTTQGSFSPYGSNWSNFFDGFGDSLRAASNAAFAPSTGDFTCEAWINISVLPSSGGVASICQNDAIGVSNNTKFYFGIVNSSGTLQLTLGRHDTANKGYVNWTPTVGVWYHVAAVRQSGTVKLFIDGVSQTVTGSTDLSGVSFSQNGFTVGAISTPVYMNGYISNFRYVVGTAVYTASFTPSTTPLTAISGTVLLTCQSNRFIDNSASPNTLTVSSNPSVQRFNPFGTSTAYATSVIGGSGFFDGTGDYLSVASNSALQFGTGNFTFECWVYPRGVAGNEFYADFGATSANGWGLYDEGAVGNLQFRIADVDRIAVDPLTTTAWSHVAVVRSGTTVTLYVNGISVGSYGSAGTDLTYSGTNYIGSQSGSSNYMNGYMGNIRAVKGTAVYTANFTPPTAPLTAISGTSLLLNYTNGAIFDNAMMNDLETVGNAQISTSVVKYGTGSIAFDGTGDYLLGPSTPNMSFGSGDFTTEAWVYRTASPGNNQTIFQKGRTADSNLEFSMILSGSNFLSCFYTTDGSTVAQPFSSTTAVALNTWTHIALTRSGSTWRCFVNGALEATTTAAVTLYTGGGLISSGSNPIGDNPFTGYIDELRITKGYARYTATFTPPTAAFPNIGPT